MNETTPADLVETCGRIADNLERVTILLAALVVLSNKGHISGGIYTPELIREAAELARALVAD